MSEATCPPLGTGSVDFDALHQAACTGADLSTAIQQATTKAEPPAEESPPAQEAPEAAPAKASPSKTDKAAASPKAE